MGCGRTKNQDVRNVTILKIPEGQAAVASKGLRTQNQLIAREAEAMVYSCMDFRLLDDIVMFMDKKGYNNNYDQFILAGCSLAFSNEKLKAWRKIAREHLDISMRLHKIKEVICIEHDECGAYKMYYPDMKSGDEKQYHIENVIKFEKKIKKTHPELIVNAYLMNLDGSCDKIN